MALIAAINVAIKCMGVARVTKSIASYSQKRLRCKAVLASTITAKGVTCTRDHASFKYAAL